MCCTGNVYHNAFINGITSQTSVTIGTETVTLKLAVHKIGDSFSKYIGWCFFIGVPMQPTLVFTVLLAKERAQPSWVQCQALCTVQNRCVKIRNWFE